MGLLPAADEPVGARRPAGPSAGARTDVQVGDDVPSLEVSVPEQPAPGSVPDAGTTLWGLAAADFAVWAGGDSAGLDRLVRRLTPMLWHVVRSYDVDRATAEDVVQATWLALVRHREGIHDPQAVVRWLSVTARREAWRLSRRSERVQPEEDSVIELRSDASESTEQLVLRKVRDDDLWQAVGRMSDRCRRLLRIVAFCERPDYASISTDLGIPVGSIGPTRGRCLAKLRALITDTRGDDR